MINKEKIDAEIRQKQQTVDYDTKEFTIELLLSKFTKGREEDENEIYVPYYQRAFVWTKEKQSKFIETIILGLPTPSIFAADLEDGRLEIVDGSQRIRTLEAFITNTLELEKLAVLESLNGSYFKDLPVPIQRKFKNTTLRLIVLSEKSDEDVRFMLFERFNTENDVLKSMEIRLGSSQGQFTKFVVECTRNPLFKKLTGFTDKAEKRKEPEELVLRFFAYSENYLDFKGNVNDFLDNYIKEKNEIADKGGFKKEVYLQKFQAMLEFVDQHFPHGFLKAPNSKKTPRLRFEAIAIGVHLALQEQPNLTVSQLTWLDSEDFEEQVKGNSSNSPSKVRARIEFVRDKLLKK
jgi:hypothetical protein